MKMIRNIIRDYRSFNKTLKMFEGWSSEKKYKVYLTEKQLRLLEHLGISGITTVDDYEKFRDNNLK